MSQYYLYAYPDDKQQWIGVGWVDGAWHKSGNSGYTDVTEYVKKNFPIDDSGWWYAYHNPMEPSQPNQIGRYEKGYWNASLPGMDRLVPSGDVGG